MRRTIQLVVCYGLSSERTLEAGDSVVGGIATSNTRSDSGFVFNLNSNFMLASVWNHTEAPISLYSRS